MSDNIKVVVKVRPLISREIEEKLSYQWRVKNNTLYQLDQNGKDLGQSFTFDKVYDKDTKTCDVYNDIAKPIVQAATAGFNGTIFAYGQTSSGKTYTMTGTESSPGIIPLAVLNLFEIIKNVPDRDFLVRVSYIEIYNETLKDLLNVEKENIKIHETLQGIKVDATEKVTSSPEEVLEAMKEGEANRQKGATNMNEQSSRSHSIFQITIESREHIEGENQGGCVNVSQLNLVDLAGSERAGQTGATGIRFKEGTHINKSLSALALVIKQLSEDPNKYTNYRDSKLTRILQNSLGGNAKTSIICAVTPAAVEETISTLQFAYRAKAIKNKPEVNAVATDATMIQQLTKQMGRLQAQLESKKNLEQDNYNLQKQINALQRLILNGFGQQRTIELMQGTKRKQPRRVTIHSTVSSIEEEPSRLPIPKFCTPSLKYNPLSIPNPSEFVPIQSSNKLASVPEEPARLITPPPRKNVNFNDDVIELDSDDDSLRVDNETCSPIHKCYGSSKTPPCILRKNAKIAEKNLKDIVELTEREKIFSPSAVELMEKLEENATMIAQLQDEIELLNKRSKEKDLENDVLKSKIKKNEDEMKALCKAKVDLQTECDNYNTKLTDWEVCYETLKKKASLREEELLSLLEEIKVNKKPEDIGKILSRTLEKDMHFMDMSKDISLVNSDNENSIVNPEDEVIHNIVSTQQQLVAKNENIVELEANLFSHKQKIASLENLTQELEDTVSTFKEKLNFIETENSLLKSTIDSLNSTISNQKSNLESVQKDLESYNNVIQELQRLSNVNIDESVLQNIITNEEQFVANNENMMNIIQSFKNALDVRNKRIAELTSKENIVTAENSEVLIQLETKTDHINKLTLQVEDLEKRINENIVMINKLMHEKNDHKIVEQELSSRLADFESKNNELEKTNNENSLYIQTLKEENNRLTTEITDKTKDLMHQIEQLTGKVADLTENCNQKDCIISSLHMDKIESEENLLKAKAAVIKSQTILGTLSGNMQEMPQLIDNFVSIFSALSDSLNKLETVATNVSIEKEETRNINKSLKAQLDEIQTKHESEITILQEQIDDLIKTLNCYKNEKDSCVQKIHRLDNDLETLHTELNSKTLINNNLEAKLNEAIELHNLETSTHKLKQEEFELALLEKDNAVAIINKKIEHYEEQFEQYENQLKEKTSELNVLEEQLTKVQKVKYESMVNIFKKTNEIIDILIIDNNTMDELDSDKIYEQILYTLDKIVNHITFINLKNVDDDHNKFSEILTKAKQEITELTQKNFDLTLKLTEIEKKNSELSLEIEINQDNNKKMSQDLIGSQELLQEVRAELETKVIELSSMENKVRELKNQFSNFDSVMHEEVNGLKIENQQLKCHIGDLKKESELCLADSNNIDSENAATNKRTLDLNTNVDIISPPSLLTICCNKIVDLVEPKGNESKSNSSLNIEVDNQSEVSTCKCNELLEQLKISKDENSKILDLLTEMEIMNQHLIQDQEIARNEIKLLLEPAQELQKKIINHKTNLSILTATTYAENKSLKSQVKVLQHHHKRFHNVCQRDIPDFKKQLSSLMTLLKGDPSVCDQQNVSFKRYSLPDVLDSSAALPNFKNESTLDGDLLMLDTNITLTTAADNTLTGHDQTCLDMTQYYSEASCQTNDLNAISDGNVPHMEILSHNHENVLEKLSMLREENIKLRELVENFSKIKNPTIDAQNSPIKNGNNLDDSAYSSNDAKCPNCKELALIKTSQGKVMEELKILTEELNNIVSEKAEIEQKYKNLILETPSTDALVKKLSIFEKEFNSQKQEIAKLNNNISIKNKELKSLQEENDTLSNQAMDYISETDNLNKELNDLKQVNAELENKCYKLEQSTKDLVEAKEMIRVCSQCIIKDDLIQAMQSKATQRHSKLNRSLSDSDTSSRYNKICTLQSELHAGREDCKELTEDVVTIKNHLDRSNLSMDLDDSMPESNIYTFPGVTSPQSKKCSMPDISEEHSLHIYTLDKIDCLNYYVEKTGSQKDNLNRDLKIVEIMKLLYENLITKHGNEVENLTNKLRDYEEAKNQLQSHQNNLAEKLSNITKELEEKDEKYKTTLEILAQIRNNINIVNDTWNVHSDYTKVMSSFKESLMLLDSEFSISSVQTFESLINNIVNKNETELSQIIDKNKELQHNIENLTAELSSVKCNLSDIKSQFTTKENEYNLLKKQNEKVAEITNAVTLDIVKREKELKDTIDSGYQKLIECNIVNCENVDSNLPLNTNINILFELLITQNKHNETDKNAQDVIQSLATEKQSEIDLLKKRGDKMHEINNAITLDLVDKENKLQALKTSYEDLRKLYEDKVSETEAHVLKIQTLSKEINVFNNTIIVERDKVVTEMSELKKSMSVLQNEISNLKSLNDSINKEKESYAEELNKCSETIKKNNIDLDKMTSDILVLRESVKENNAIIENLSAEAKSLLKQNTELKEQLESKSRECMRLETNIKTHEKTAQIQSRMIMRLDKQKIEDDKAISESKKELDDITQLYTKLMSDTEIYKTELEELRHNKAVLEARITELETSLEEHKSRPSMDGFGDPTRRRRQSLYDSKRTFAEDRLEIGDHNSVEAVFDSKPKPDDLFTEADGDVSNRSTPIRLSKGRDSLSMSRTDQSDKEDEHPSRPSSVLESRRRRQTLHDSHRCELSHTPSPHAANDSSMSQLRERLACCQQELEDLKEKYRELDEECETCAEYLKERDEQCARLKKEKLSLENTITELKEKLQSCNPNLSQMNTSRPKVAHASVNTDEDWANLHSVVVDRMSYDAEVEKNKKLTKTIEELRFKKQDLKNTLAKMQKAIEKNSGIRELEMTKQELQICKQELSQLKEKYKELDEECETCAQYLRDKEDQCRRLKEAKSELEIKLQEIQSDMKQKHSTRKKRQSIHDLNRTAAINVADATTETSDDFLSYQVERDGSSRPLVDQNLVKEVKHLKAVVEKLSQQKSVLEQQLVSMSVPAPAMYVATGSAIVQNQQITDVMKENQKLKKINAKLVHLCKKRGKDSNRENEEPENRS